MSCILLMLQLNTLMVSTLLSNFVNLFILLVLIGGGVNEVTSTLGLSAEHPILVIYLCDVHNSLSCL